MATIGSNQLDTNQDRVSQEKYIQVLCVDDDACLLEVSKQILQMEANFKIDTAKSVDDAFKKLEEQTYDAIISDYEMPHKNGLDFLKELKERKNETPFILFTGRGREEVAITALNLGADGYYNKQGSPETVYGELSHGIKIASERRRAKQALEESEKRYRNLMEHASDAIIIHDLKGEIIDANQQACKGLGYTKEEMLSLNVADVDPEATENRKGGLFWAKVLAGRNVTFETIHKRKDQTVFPVEVSLSSIVVGNETYISALSRDNSERKAKEDALRKIRCNFAEAQRIAHIGSWEWDIKTKLVFWSDELYRIFGLEPQVNPVKPQFFIDRIHPEDKEAVLRDINLSKVKGTPANSEFRILLPNGSIHTVIIKGETEFDESKNPLRIVGTVQDITERKQAEAELRESKEEYQSLFVNMLDGVAYCKMIFDEEAKPIDFVYLEVNDAFERITGLKRENVIGKKVTEAIPGTEKAHPELLEIYGRVAKTGKGEKFEIFFRPLGIWLFISVYCPKAGYFVAMFENVSERKLVEEQLQADKRRIEMVTEKLRVIGSLTRHDVRNKLTVTKGNAFLLRKMIGDKPELIQYLNGIDAGINDANKIFDFSNIYEKIGVEKPSEVNVEHAFNEAVASFSNLQKIKVVNKCCNLSVTADSLLRQLFYNLIDNSLKHGEKVTQIQLYCQRENDHNKLIYEDDGVGILQANKPKLFTTGFTTGKGTGLGLKLIKRMMDVYGWTIQETGKPGKGAKFVMTIPNE